MFRRLEDELKSFEMDDDWECSYCGIGVADDLELSKFVCAKCAEEFVFCAECFYETHRKFMGEENEEIRKAGAERQSFRVSEVRKKKLQEEEEEEKRKTLKKKKKEDKENNSEEEKNERRRQCIDEIKKQRQQQQQQEKAEPSEQQVQHQRVPQQQQEPDPRQQQQQQEPKQEPVHRKSEPPQRVSKTPLWPSLLPVMLSSGRNSSSIWRKDPASNGGSNKLPYGIMSGVPNVGLYGGGAVTSPSNGYHRSPSVYVVNRGVTSPYSGANSGVTSPNPSVRIPLLSSPTSPLIDSSPTSPRKIGSPTPPTSPTTSETAEDWKRKRSSMLRQFECLPSRM